jgi:hypothetical protein
MNDIKIGKIGRIVAGNDSGWFIKIEDDSQNTGGYLILIANSPNFAPCSQSEGYNYRVENQSALEGFFKHSKWQINWDI